MESAPDHRAEPSGFESTSAAIGGAERRRGDRLEFQGWLVLVWHHRPGEPMRYQTVDVSETGARIRTTCCHPDGMTGTAIELVADFADGGNGGVGEGHACVGGAATNHGVQRVPIRRSFIVVWSRAIRRDEGRLDHHEAGLRFI